MRTAIVLLLSLITASYSAHAAPKKELWVYTSIYKEFIAPIEAAFEAQFPEYDVQVFQGGSEKIQAKVEAELVAKKPQADILLTSDPFWSWGLKERGLAATRPGHEAVETNYYSLMVLIAHKDFPQASRPKSFTDLTKPEYKNLIQLGSPLESGTMFASVAYLSKKYGWSYFEKLKANNLASSGGNSLVIQKVESGEKKLGMVLLENALAAKKRGSPIDIIYPEDGSIPIPSVQVLLKDARNSEGAAKFADFVLSEAGQKLLVNGFMYSVLPTVSAATEAKPLKEATARSTPWTTSILLDVAKNARDIKKKFASLILE